MGLARESEQDFYNSVNSSIYLTSILDWYKLPVDETNSVLVVSISSTAATYVVIAYTVLVTMIFMAACELATLLVLTFFTVGKNGTRHAMLIAYYNSGSPSRNLPLMLGYIYSGFFRCRKAGRWAVDWHSLRGSCLLFAIALLLISGDTLTKFFLGGRALIQANIAQANPKAVFYPDFGPNDENTRPGNLVAESVYDAFKGPRGPAVHQAIARKTSAGREKLHAKSRIAYTQWSETLNNSTDPTAGPDEHWRFTYRYNISGYELGLRDAPGLVFAVDGRCETYHNPSDSVISELLAFVNYSSNNRSSPQENVDRYPWWSSPVRTMGTLVPRDREKYSAPWVSFQAQYDDRTIEENKQYGGFNFQLVPHTANRSTISQNSADPWYKTMPNPDFINGTEEEISQTIPYNTRYCVRFRRRPMRCTQNDTYSYKGETVNHISKLELLPGLKLSPLVRFVLQREFGVPVFGPILSYVPYGSLYSAIHFDSNQRRLDAKRASIANDFRELVEIGYVYSREVVRNTVLLFPSLVQDEQSKDNVIINAAGPGQHASTVDKNDVDFLVESQEVAALSVVTLIVTPVVCVFLWIMVFCLTWLFTSQARLDNKSAAGRHSLRRSGLQATHLYRFLDEELSKERRWCGRNTNTPFIRDLDMTEPTLNDEEAVELQIHSSTKSDSAGTTEILEAKSDYPKPKLVQVPVGMHVGDAAPEENKGIWSWVKRNIFRQTAVEKVEYEVTLTKAWDPKVPAVKRARILRDL